MTTQTEKLCTAGETINKAKREPTERKKVFTNLISDKGLIPKYTKNSYNSRPKKEKKKKNPNDLSKKRAEDLNRPFPEKTSRQPADTRGEAQRHSSSGKYIKTMHHPTSVRRTGTKKTTTRVGKEEGTGEPSCTVGGSANGTSLLENSRKVPQKVKSRTTL